MDAVWGKGDHIQIVHPGSACIAGRELVSAAELSTSAAALNSVGVYAVVTASKAHVR
jgi:hypothetical protein